MHRPPNHLTLLITLLLLTAAGPLPSSAQTNSASPVSPDAYPLNLQDKLLFSIQQDPAPGSAPDELFVNALGQIHFRISQGFDDTITLRVQGKTLQQVKTELKARLDADFYQNATVELKLMEQTRKAGQVLFFGAVRSNFLPLAPGEPKTIFEGVHQVGVNEFANLKKIKLHRLDPQTGRSTSQVIDLEAIRKGDREKDIPLQDGDRVEVPEKRIVF